MIIKRCIYKIICSNQVFMRIWCLVHRQWLLLKKQALSEYTSKDILWEGTAVGGIPRYMSVVHDVCVGEQSDSLFTSTFLLDDSLKYDLRGFMMCRPSFYRGGNRKWAMVEFYPCKHIPCGIWMVKLAVPNWYHFLFECLSKLVYIKGLHEFDEWPIIVDRQLMDNDHCRTLLEEVSEEREIVVLEHCQRLYIDKLLVLPKVVLVKHAKNEIESMWHYDIRIKEFWADFCREYRKKHFMEGQMLGGRIYCKRKDDRLVNSCEVENYLYKEGFSIVDSSEMDIHEEIKMFANAEIVISIVGAASANTVFMKKNSLFGCICTERMISQSAMALAGVVAPRIENIIACNVGFEKSGIGKMYLPIKELKKFLEIYGKKM